MARKPRVVAVECETPSGWRWLKRYVRGAVLLADNRFRVTDESEWRNACRLRSGREVS
jgi:hypothetical protein